MKISVIIPAFNEAKRITPTIQDIIGYLDKVAPKDYEILIVLDGSKDNTLDIVTKLAEQYKAIRIIHNSINRGKGAVVRQGILESIGDYVLFMDADNSTRIQELNAMLPVLEQGIDVIIGSRDIKGSKVEIHQVWYKELLGDLGNWWIQIILVGGIQDTQCGFKVFSGKSGRHIFEKISMQGWSFDIEVLALARYFGYTIKEMPVIWYNDNSSHVTLGDYIAVLRDTFTIRYRIWTGYYQ
jgi:dolichyl-phosphate beta-glucosyltransferase